jgi:hypothetical protein
MIVGHHLAIEVLKRKIAGYQRGMGDQRVGQ